jgi:hypothetical protein
MVHTTADDPKTKRMCMSAYAPHAAKPYTEKDRRDFREMVRREVAFARDRFGVSGVSGRKEIPFVLGGDFNARVGRQRHNSNEREDEDEDEFLGALGPVLEDRYRNRPGSGVL